MSSDDVMIDARDVGKDYLIYEKPSHRLWQMIFRGMHTFFRAHTVLRGITFQVRRGETVGLVGRNGSGKSTLLAMICGTLPPTSGEVRVNGRVAALLELGAGFNPEISGLENIDLCAQIYGLTAEQVRQRRQSIVDFADIGDYIEQPVKTYSSGMFTRLAFSVVAHVDAEILVIDEALAVGDAYFVQKCMRFLAAFKEKGGTLLFVSHDMGAISSLCDRAIWLRDSAIVMDAAPKQIANAYLADLYHAQQGATPVSAAVSDDAAVEDAPVEYGLTRNIDSFNLWRIATHEWRDIVTDVYRSQQWSDRLGYLLRGPGWAYARRVEQPTVPAIRPLVPAAGVA